jgi:hypothetical protein
MDYVENMDGVFISEVAIDDLPPAVRECFRANMAHDWEHQRQCPDCLGNDADHLLMEAASHWEDGNVEDAQALELEAAVLQRRAEEFRDGT